MKELSVLLITWNSEQYVQSCLNSLLNAIEEVDYEVIMVDNGSTDQTLTILETYVSERISLYRNPQNLGIAKARNRGLRLATGRFIWILDIDTIIERSAWTGMSAFMNTHPDCGICGCKLYNSLGQVQESCRHYPTARYKLFNILHALLKPIPFLKQLDRQIVRLNESQFYHTQIARNEPFEVEYVIGACQLIRREVVEDIGLLDEHIFYGPEDADYCLRANRAGWRVYYLPNYAFQHDYQQLTNKRFLSKMSWLHLKALLYFFIKHRRF